MKMDGLVGGAELAKMLRLSRGKYCICLHNGKIHTIKIREKLVLDANSPDLAGDDDLVPRRATHAQLRNFLRAKNVEELLRKRLGLFGRVVLTIKDGKVIHEDWCSGLKPD